ncbi:MAG TPA: hypothetical protein DCL77_17440 [Prolixibacteraceae bacterium]|jgi:hypothetical protein|nr:hypothetical protein [Prolixibacteraceae bacterium]
MRGNFSSFIIEIVGAFIVWAFKGFKGSLSDEMSGPYESNRKTLRNASISFAILFLIIATGYKFQEKKNREENKNVFEITIKK